jgi:hypothetical protein
VIDLLALLTAIAISTIAAYYSIIGLTTIFSGAFWSIVIMASILEIGKVVTTSWLYSNWAITPRLIKYYLVSAIFVLMFITSIGIFGFLSKAHIDKTISTGDSVDQISLIEQKIEFEENNIKDSKTVISQLDQSVKRLTDNDRIRGPDGAIAVRSAQKEERKQYK